MGIAGSSDISSCKMKAQDNARKKKKKKVNLSVFSVLEKEAGEERSIPLLADTV